MKYIIIDKNDNLRQIIDYLNNKLGLPQIHRKLNIFSKQSDIQIEMIDDKIYYVDKFQQKFNFIKNKNLKRLLKYIHSNNKYGFYIRECVLLSYFQLDLVFDIYNGNIIKTSNKAIIHYLNKKYNFKVYEKNENYEVKKQIEVEYIFDEIGNLNPKIRNYANKVGIDIRSTSTSLKVRLSNVSNDYSCIEKYYNLITNCELLSTKSSNKYVYKFKEMSIIIPVYNQDVIPTLLSIQGQSISLKDKRHIQVIVVDDGSKSSVYNNLKSIKELIDFELDIITLSENKGLSNARNVGLALAKHDMLLFIDSDIILSKNYLYDLNVRLQIIPNSIIVAMRKNIKKDDERISYDNLLKGVEKTLIFDDSRVNTKCKEYHIGWDKAYKDETIFVLDDTNYFKELSFGSQVGIYDLPGVVTGHNIGINRNVLKKVSPFCTKFKGWGFEDSYFAAELIADGNYVIPMVSSCVYHIEHLPRCGNMKKKQVEAIKNYKLYHMLLDETWE